MVTTASYPFFGPEIPCPLCTESMSGLILTESYLCRRHGQFNAKPTDQELEFADTRKCWRRWKGQWYQCHQRLDTLRYEIGNECRQQFSFLYCWLKR